MVIHSRFISRPTSCLKTRAIWNACFHTRTFSNAVNGRDWFQIFTDVMWLFSWCCGQIDIQLRYLRDISYRSQHGLWYYVCELFVCFTDKSPVSAWKDGYITYVVMKANKHEGHDLYESRQESEKNGSIFIFLLHYNLLRFLRRGPRVLISQID